MSALMKALLEAAASDSRTENKPLPIKEVQLQALHQYAAEYQEGIKASKKYAAGDRVRRNRLGKKTYSVPRSNETAVIIRKLDTPMLGENDTMVTGLLAIYTDCPRCAVHTYAVDLALFELDDSALDISLMEAAA